MDNQKTPSIARTILIVDDDEFVRGYLRILLGDLTSGEISVASNGKSALTATSQQQPDLILLDINLPDSDGIDLLKTLQEESPNSTILMISSEATSERVQAALQNGAKGFIAKPFNASTVVNKIKDMLLAEP